MKAMWIVTHLRCTDFTCTLESCLCPIVAKCLVRVERTLFLANLPGLFRNKRRGKGEGLASRRGRKVLRLFSSRQLVNTEQRNCRTEESFFLGLPVLRGNTTRRSLYAFSRSTLIAFPSTERFRRRWSTTMPNPSAALRLTPASFSSPRVKPRPSRSFVLYCTV